jgi:hypothetical protein
MLLVPFLYILNVILIQFGLKWILLPCIKKLTFVEEAVQYFYPIVWRLLSNYLLNLEKL